MRMPYRKPGKYSSQEQDTHISQAKYDELSAELASLQKRKIPAAQEVSRLAELGDFSENVEYQLAKRKLRGIISRITKVEFLLNKAVIISPKQKNKVEQGHTLTIAINGAKKDVTILGSQESDPANGILSHLSPIGSAILGKQVGETVEVETPTTTLHIEIIAIQ